ncbi:MAG: peptidase U32 family protein [Chitinivibrionales bacterium]
MNLSKKPELLAPAGSIECFHAAMDAGADAVYCGLVDFNARLRARNFTVRTLAYLVPYAHSLKRKIYVTVNVLVKHIELEKAVNLLYQLEQLKVDGIIVQDLGIVDICRRYFPGLKLHASTQMALHNGPGIAVAKSLGIKRVVLARELTLREIASIRKNTALELEVFVHGALCYCFSGMCMASSFLGGSSGNRGRCTQVCRRPFSTGIGKGHFFSTADLCALSFLAEFRDMGIDSLKIEGRMKNADYVATVVGLYRKALDDPRILPDLMKKVDADLGRKKTTLFLDGIKHGGIIDPAGPTGTGLLIGEIRCCNGSEIVVAREKMVGKGDLIRIQPQSGFEGANVRVAGVSVAGDLQTLRLTDRIACATGDTVYLTRLASAPGNDKRARKITLKPIPFMQQYNDVKAVLQSCSVKHDANKTGTKPRLLVKIDDAAWVPHLESVDVDALIVAVEREGFNGLFSMREWVDMWAQKTIIGFPPFIAEDEVMAWKNIVREAQKKGVFRAMCQNLGQLRLADGAMKTYADAMLWCFNGAAQKALKDCGLSGFTYSWEDDYLNIRSAASFRGMAYLFSYVPLFISRIRPALGPGEKIKDSFENEFFTAVKHDLHYLIAKKPLCLLHKRNKLEEAGVKTFIIDLSFCAPDKRLYRDLIKRYNDGTKVPGSSMFNFKAGIK